MINWRIILAAEATFVLLVFALTAALLVWVLIEALRAWRRRREEIRIPYREIDSAARTGRFYVPPTMRDMK